MLEQCPACEGKVSAQASACPHCGHPIGKPTDTVRSERTITTQETGKAAKVQQVIAVVILLIGFAGLAGGEQSAGILLVVGLVWLIAARFYAWWQYG